ncbi:regulator [Streptomyces erythrochromogenes]|uniref:ATP-binding protein n=1 Tax=Streptomyces erythrochromogenes TaxID=285574 RepID=UPI003440AC06
MDSWMPPAQGSFVGRTGEIDELVTGLRTHRLVTLVGGGGVGKSRLAAQTVRRVPDEPYDAVYWAPLWSLSGRPLFAAAVADACGLSDHSTRDQGEALGSWIGGRRVLLVLDSCEHVRQECAALVEALLAHCPRLVVLATSRETLGVRGERVQRVHPLDPETDGLELLTERAGAVGVRWTGPADRAAAAAVCRWLEGVPLALELAAGMLGEHGVGELAAGLGRRLELGGSRGMSVGPARHRALVTTIGWSHELCSPAERLLWARMSVFRSDPAPDAVLDVCAGGPLGPGALADALAGLQDKSIVTVGNGRVRMLDTVREYGAMWLAEIGESGAVADRHAGYFSRATAAADEAWWGRGQQRAYAGLAHSHDDLCAALEHLLLTAPEEALAMVGRLGFFWACCGHLHEAGHYLDEFLQLVTAPAAVQAKALWSLGVVRCLQGSYDLAQRLSREARVVAEVAGEGALVADAAYLHGLVLLLRGKPLTALHEADRVLAASIAGPASGARCRLLRVFGLTGSGFLAQARTEAEALRADSVAVGEYWARSYADYQLAVIALHEERAADAAGHARSMLRGKRAIGDAFGLALGLDLLAVAFADQGRGELSAGAYGLGHRFWQMVGHPQRGTPELGALREQGERSARSQVGDAAYERAYQRATAAEPHRTLDGMLADPVDGRARRA